ncbi:conserved exported protein of unknown function (plasmid) [Pararobbsia alpina]|uniref:hypothetical protein n=1 Tax=Pararobbsia alpina TaxID=621374 RepID=UPI0039A5ACAC
MKKQLVTTLSIGLLVAAGALSSTFAQAQTAHAAPVSQGVVQSSDAGNTAASTTQHKAPRLLKWLRAHENKGSQCVGPASFCDIYFG